MSLYAFLEPLILGLVLVACCAACLRRFAPGLWRRLSGKSSPSIAKAGCESACSSGCGGCGSATPDDQASIRVHTRPSA